MLVNGAWGFVAAEWSHTILKMHLYGRPIRRFAHPDVEIFAFASFEEKDIIAIVKLG